jgi:hypothetical protein
MSVVAAAESFAWFGVRVRTSDLARRAAVEFPKTAAEIGIVAKADVIRDCPYVPVAILRLAEHAIGAS